jgi:hypothetical protein
MGLNSGGASAIFNGILKPPFSLLSPAPNDFLLPLIGFFVSLTIGVASSPPGVRVLSGELALFKRETGSGHSASAYYVGKTLSVLPRIVLTSAHFVAVFVVLLGPRADLWVTLLWVTATSYCVYGVAAIISVVAHRENAALWAVIISMALGSLCGYSPTLNNAGTALRVFYAVWGVEAFYSSEVTKWADTYDIEASRQKFGYVLEQYGLDFGMMVAIGSAYRVLAFAILVIPWECWERKLKRLYKHGTRWLMRPFAAHSK